MFPIAENIDQAVIGEPQDSLMDGRAADAEMRRDVLLGDRLHRFAAEGNDILEQFLVDMGCRTRCRRALLHIGGLRG